MSRLDHLFLGKNGNYYIYSSTNSEQTKNLLLKDFQKYLKKNNGTTYLYESEYIEGIIGFSRLDWDSDLFGFNCSSLDYLLINTESDKKPLFDSLYETAHDWMKENGVKFMVAKFDPSSMDLIQLLEKRNFQIREEIVSMRSTLEKIRDFESIRKFRKNEIEAIGKISADSFAYSRFMKDTNFENDKARELNYMWAVNCCNGRSDEVLVADVNGKPAGFVTCNIEKFYEVKYGNIQLLAIDKPYRNRGLGRQLVRASLNWFKDRECQFVNVDTQSDNSSAISLYNKSGFKIVSSKLTLHKWL